MATAQQVMDLIIKTPTLTTSQIAERLGCSTSYVRATFQRRGWKRQVVWFKPERTVSEVAAKYLERL